MRVRALGVIVVLVAATPVAAGPVIGGCAVFPPDNVWNTRIDQLPVAADSALWVASIGANANLHPDFGADPSYGIPHIVVAASEMPRTVDFYWPDESDPGPYPIPLSAPIEQGDAHVLAVQQGSCKLYELYDASVSGSGWSAGSGAVFDLQSNALRPDGWTSADAAGLPILPGLVRRDEVLSGRIDHALRFTADVTQDSYIWPARHQAGDADPGLPPLGIRVRLRADYPETGLSSTARVIVRALKEYGMILADNGGNWFFTGETNTSWNDDDLNELKAVRGSDFEVVDESALMVDPDSGEARIFKGDFD
ncbi:MAG TPA: hypothetical protein VFN09_14540 [Rhodanobacteraceae bacterium]|nr:hypothetical protein [Rhodanobacteraceae bacterium]